MALRWIGLLVFLSLAGGCREPKRQVTIAAASDLAIAFEEVGRAFQKQSGIKPTFRFGSSGLLAQQMRENAPFDIFASANVHFVDSVIDAGACHRDTKYNYALGRIVVWSKDQRITALTDLADPRFAKISIAHPEHAPYGKAAKEALEATGAWEAVKGKLVFGENIRQTMQWAQTGDVDASIVALALAVVTEGGNTFPVDDKLHKPLVQALAVCKHGGHEANGRAFVAFLRSPAGVEIMKRFGFSLPAS
jgi:molybdate transport system substrate-binding protein